jgi:hypothetical protein
VLPRFLEIAVLLGAIVVVLLSEIDWIHHRRRDHLGSHGVPADAALDSGRGDRHVRSRAALVR